MLKDEKIEELIKSNPEIVEEFKDKNWTILTSVRFKFQTLIASGDLVGSYLLAKYLSEIIEIQEEVGKQHVRHIERMKKFGIVKSGGADEVLHFGHAVSPQNHPAKHIKMLHILANFGDPQTKT